MERLVPWCRPSAFSAAYKLLLTPECLYLPAILYFVQNKLLVIRLFGKFLASGNVKLATVLGYVGQGMWGKIYERDAKNE